MNSAGPISGSTLEVMEGNLRALHAQDDRAALDNAINGIDNNDLWLLKDSFEKLLGNQRRLAPPKRSTAEVTSISQGQTDELLKDIQTECEKRLSHLEAQLRESSNPSEFLRGWVEPLLHDLIKSVSLDKVKTGTQTQEFIRQQEKMRKMTPTVEGVTESERATLKELQE
ncbi:MAG TPA: hypothetical protein VM532_17690, partial [Burkholderiales bacterium]|nr:hypothetical protein [Burkholderiales bacterium]